MTFIPCVIFGYMANIPISQDFRVLLYMRHREIDRGSTSEAIGNPINFLLVMMAAPHSINMA